MTENKRFTIEERDCYNYGIRVMDIIKDNGIELPQSTACDLLNRLHEENQELKKQNMEYYHLINCGNCKHHNYDWYDDGDEFEVCEKGNNERLMYNKFCKNWEGD